MLLLLFLCLFMSLHIAQVHIQAIKSRVPDVAVGFQPCVKLVEWLSTQLVDALLGDWMRLDEPGNFEYAEMFGDLRLAQTEPLGDISHRTGAITQEFDNVQSV
jgi:hypothetical protein